MDILTQSQTKSYDYDSRYGNFTFYYNTRDDKYMYGLISQLDEDCAYVIHKVEQADTLDSLSAKYYGRPDYYCFIGLFNHILDCFEPLYGKFETIKIPSLGTLKFV